MGVVVVFAAATMLAVFRFRPEDVRVPRDPERELPPAAPPVDLDALRAAGM